MDQKRGMMTQFKILAVFIVVLLLISAGVIVNNLVQYKGIEPGVMNCGTDEECFLNNANQCTPATGLAEISGAVVKNEIFEECLLKKEIIELPKDEPVEFKILFEDKVMICPYQRNNFDPNLAYTLSIGMEPCGGSLKNAITAFLAASEDYQ